MTSQTIPKETLTVLQAINDLLEKEILILEKVINHHDFQKIVTEKERLLNRYTELATLMKKTPCPEDEKEQIKKEMKRFTALSAMNIKNLFHRIKAGEHVLRMAHTVKYDSLNNYHNKKNNLSNPETSPPLLMNTAI